MQRRWWVSDEDHGGLMGGKNMMISEGRGEEELQHGGEGDEEGEEGEEEDEEDDDCGAYKRKSLFVSVCLLLLFATIGRLGGWFMMWWYLTINSSQPSYVNDM